MIVLESSQDFLGQLGIIIRFGIVWKIKNLKGRPGVGLMFGT